MKKTHLYAGIYVEIENDMIKLTAEVGGKISNTIYLPDIQVRNLIAFAQAADREKFGD